MRVETLWRSGLIGLAGLVLIVAGSPLVALWLPPPLRRHAYDEFSYQVIADAVLPQTDDRRAVITAAFDYVRQRLWAFPESAPYDGHPMDYLVEGVGWCDYVAKVFCKLMAARGLRARYDFLFDASGASPHTVAEIFVDGKWRALDPLFGLTYITPAGVWVELDAVTPELVERLPEAEAIRAANPSLYDAITGLARRTYPLPRPPQQSDDFLAERHAFDVIAGWYAHHLGRGFAMWYQDQFLRRELSSVTDPAERLWRTARHRDLYDRRDQAGQTYRQLLAEHPNSLYRDRARLFYGQLLLRQRQFATAAAVFEDLLRDRTNAEWARFQLGQCYEALGRAQEAAAQYERYQRMQESKFPLEAAQRLGELGPRLSATVTTPPS